METLCQVKDIHRQRNSRPKKQMDQEEAYEAQKVKILLPWLGVLTNLYRSALVRTNQCAAPPALLRHVISARCLYVAPPVVPRAISRQRQCFEHPVRHLHALVTSALPVGEKNLPQFFRKRREEPNSRNGRQEHGHRTTPPTNAIRKRDGRDGK